MAYLRIDATHLLGEVTRVRDCPHRPMGIYSQIAVKARLKWSFLRVSPHNSLPKKRMGTLLLWFRGYYIIIFAQYAIIILHQISISAFSCIATSRTQCTKYQIREFSAIRKRIKTAGTDPAKPLFYQLSALMAKTAGTDPAKPLFYQLSALMA